MKRWLSLVLIFVSACASAKTLQTKDQPVFGIFFEGWEVYAFKKCGEDWYWKMEHSREVGVQLQKAIKEFASREPPYKLPQPYRSVSYWPILHLVVHGDVSEEDEHLKTWWFPYERRISVNELIEVRLATLDEITACLRTLDDVFSRSEY